ncbi:butyrate kinase [bacterium 210820-DFI.6.37]|nr:butyrate kinase [bacterium 210820-DFI.6.37]
MDKERILVINPGSTSTKVAVYDDMETVFVENVAHSEAELAAFKELFDQYEYRKKLVLEAMERHEIDKNTLTTVVSRGGLLPPVPSGAFEVNDDIVWQLKNKPQNEHPSNLGAAIAKSIADDLGLTAYIYDPVTVDEMDEIAKVAGLPEMRRKSLGHPLNMRAVAHKYARKKGRAYGDMNLIIAHLGGGITISLHKKGRMIDMISDEEGPFSPERTGGLPLFQVIDEATQEQETQKTMMKRVKRQGGLVAHLGTNDARKVEEMIANGDQHAALVYEAMANSISKHIASLAAVARGNVDAIILTGGVAHSKMLTEWIIERVSFIAEVEVIPGENEMEALVSGVLRVRRGQEKVRTFKKVV